MITRRRFNALARSFGLRSVSAGKTTPRRFHGIVHSYAPQCGVDAGRWVGVSDAFLAMFGEAEAVYTLGHEAGHVVHEHYRRPGRAVYTEIEADMWGLEALTAHGYDLQAAPRALRAMLAAFPCIDSKGEISARLRALAYAIETGSRDALDITSATP